MMKFLKIENTVEGALKYQEAGVDRIFLDLEILGKRERQKGLNTVISSNHSIDDVKKLSTALSKSELLVRVNPIHKGSIYEIERCILDGADVIMLPMFKTKGEVEEFISIVNGRAKTCLLLETAQAVCRIDDILAVDGIDEIHIGLNDLHLSMGLNFMFELLSGGIVDYIISKIRSHNIVYGFGGIAPLGIGAIEGGTILKEHVRLGSTMVILSRQFDKIISTDFKLFCKELSKMKEEYIRVSKECSTTSLRQNTELLRNKVKSIVENV